MQQTITINSILGGQSPMTHFAGEGQFRASLGIDPAQPITDTIVANSVIASGLLRPVPVSLQSSGKLSAAPFWIKEQPKGQVAYVYDQAGHTYSVLGSGASFTALSSLGAAAGNGMEYYDNYMYFAKNTDIARYGPLNGSPAWNTTYWTGQLSATALTNTTYPADPVLSLNYPNHPMHRHSDNKLYIGDVSASNEGILNYIQTSRTSVEGDTNDGSTYGVLKFPFGFWPIDIETYGTDLAIALIENSGTTNTRQPKSKIAFWDTTSTSYNKITYVEFPDTVITALKNINGVLYAFSGNVYSSFANSGFRVVSFNGGYSYQEVISIETGFSPFSGAIDGDTNRILIGNATDIPESNGCVFSIGLQKAGLSNGLFNVMPATGNDSSTRVTALRLLPPNTMSFNTPLVGWTKGSGGSNNGLDAQNSTYGTVANVWWSQLYRVGKPFQIKKVRIPLATTMAANMTITAKIYTDDGNGTTFTMPTINNTNYPSAHSVVFKTDVSNNIPSGKSNFWLELRWTGSALCVVGLPITIEIDTLDD